MKKLLSIFAISLCVLGPVSGLAGEAATLRITGEASVSAVPDMARLQLGVRKDAKEAVGASKAVGAALAQVMKELDAVGIKPKDMQTTQLSLAPQLDYSGSGAPRKLGYQAQSTLTVTLYDIDQIGVVLDKVLFAGATEFAGLNFDLTNRKTLRGEAMQQAVKSARRDAELLAKAAGMSLGKVITLSYGPSGGPVPIMMARGMAEASSMPIAAGETDISAQVQMEFELISED